MLDPLVLEPPLKHVVGPATKAGIRVDIFLDLASVWNGRHHDYRFPPAAAPGHLSSHTEAELTHLVEHESHRYGASLVSVVVRGKLRKFQKKSVGI